MWQYVAALGLAGIAVSVSEAGNWGHWRGDDGNGTAAHASPPVRWSATSNVKWKKPVPGRGSSSPVVWNDRIFLTSAVPVGESDANVLRFEVICFSRQNGGILWRKTASETAPHEGTHPTNGFASASPVTDGERVYASFGSRGVYCYSLDGELLWDRNFGEMTMRAGFGEGSSPTLVGDLLVLPWDHEGQSFVYAIAKRTGETVWATPRDEPSCWATPIAMSVDGRTQVILNGQNYVRSYDAETGRELWRCSGQTARPVASPVRSDRLVFVGSGFQGSFLGTFDPRGRGDIRDTEFVVWTIDRDTPDIGSPLLSGDRLYFFKAKTGIISCVDADTGTPHYLTQRVGLGTIYASPVTAGGFVFLTDRNGKTVVIEDAPQLRLVSTNSVGETVDATPAPVDDELFIRGEEHLFCISE